MTYDKVQGSLVGLAVGDAIGTTLEFKTRDTEPVLTDMIGGGVFGLEPGQWTDDTSMALCLGESLLTDGFDVDSQLALYSKWYTEGYMSSNGYCFDIGIGTSKAIRKWKEIRSTINNDSFFDSGNGSLMRLAPVVIHGCIPEGFNEQYLKLLQNIVWSSETTHAYVKPSDACVGLGVILNRLYNGDPLDKAIDFFDKPPAMYGITDSEVISVLEYSYMDKERDEIKSTGFCIDTLEAALWCVTGTDNFKDAVLLAANLGDDADTVAAVTGQIAGAYYGLSGIPTDWVSTLHKGEFIANMAKELYDLSPCQN